MGAVFVQIDLKQAVRQKQDLTPSAAGRPGLSALFCAAALALLSHGTAAAAGFSIGAIVPESSPSIEEGKEIRNGMLLALKTSSIQPTPTLIVKDGACDAAPSEAAAKALVAAKVDVVLAGWCGLGLVPSLLDQAGVPLVSANSERFKAAEGGVQLARVGPGVSEQVAAKLRREIGLRVTAGSMCWVDHRPAHAQKFDATLCPVLAIDPEHHKQVAGAYTAAFRAPFSSAAARGYAAMEVALTYLKKLKAGAKPAAALAEAQASNTLLGAVPARDGATPPEAMVLILGDSRPRLRGREAEQFAQLIQAKGCGAKPNASNWGAQPFVLQGADGRCVPASVAQTAAR